MAQPFSGNETCRFVDANKIEAISASPILEAFFSINDLISLQMNPAYVGIRLYPATTNGGNNTILPNEENGSLIAVGVDVNRNDIFTTNGTEFVLSGGKEIAPASRLNKVTAQNNSDPRQPALTIDGANVPDSEKRSGFFSVYFSKFSVNQLLSVPGCAGIRFYCHQLENHPDPAPKFHTEIKPLTLTAVPVNSNDERLLVETNVFGLESLAPCPPDCGDPERYLNPYDIDLSKGVNPQPSTT
ncbi:MAG: hypothetical protein KDE26_20200 [Bacteroidetes bacterium]|nr:hypothetical protein [Bacteroidota bacterium]